MFKSTAPRDDESQLLKNLLLSKISVYNSKDFKNLCAVMKVYGVYSGDENRNKKIDHYTLSKDKMVIRSRRYNILTYVCT